MCIRDSLKAGGHTVAMTGDGRKLSKREGDLNMEELRRRYTPERCV